MTLNNKLRIIHARETLYFSHVDGILKQWVEVSIENFLDKPGLARFTIKAGGEEVETQVEIIPGYNVYRVYAPVLLREQSVDLHALVRVDSQGEMSKTETTIGSHRPWKVYLLSDACVDYVWAYEDEQKMRSDDAALVLAEIVEAEKCISKAEANHNHYNLVHSREIEYFLEHYPDQAQRLFKHFQDGSLTLNPVLNMTSTTNLSLEGLIRSLYPAHRLAKQHDLDDDYANLQETPTAAWGMASILAGSGVQHLVRSVLPYECPWAKRLEEPPIYFWEGPDGSRILVRLRKKDYVEGNFVLNGIEATRHALHDEILPGYEGGDNPYPFDSIALVGCYGDLSGNSKDMPAQKTRTVDEYNSQGWEYPVLINASHKQFWDDIDNQIKSGKIDVPVIRGDYGTSWEGWAACMAYDFAAWRRAQELGMTADALAAILSRLDENWYDDHRQALEEGWSNVLYLADHAWNGATEGNRILNIALRRQWQERANEILDSVISEGLNTLGEKISTGTTPSLLVFNSLPWKRTGLVRAEVVDLKLPIGIIDGASGEVLPTQPADEDGKQFFYFAASDVPSVGYHTYTLLSDASGHWDESNGISIGKNWIESPYYRLEVNQQSGGIQSLYDKVRSKELVDNTSPFDLDEAVYFSEGSQALSNPSGPYPVFQQMDLSGLKEFRARLTSIESGAFGPVFGELKVLTVIGNIMITNVYRVFRDLDQVEISNTVEKPVTTEKQELDFAFPFLVPGREYRYDAPGALINPDKDYRPGAGQAWTTVRHFVEIFNADYGVTLSMADSGLVEFGHRTTGEDPLEVDSTNSTLFAVALENCLDWNESIHDQAGISHFFFRFRICGHSGGVNPVEAIHFGWEDNHELLSLTLPAQQKGVLTEKRLSFFTVSPPSIISADFKVAEEEGLIAHLWECAGQETQAEIRTDGLGELRAVLQTNLLEDDLNFLPVENGQASLHFNKGGLAAIRLKY